MAESTCCSSHRSFTAFTFLYSLTISTDFLSHIGTHFAFVSVLIRSIHICSRVWWTCIWVSNIAQAWCSSSSIIVIVVHLLMESRVFMVEVFFNLVKCHVLTALYYNVVIVLFFESSAKWLARSEQSFLWCFFTNLKWRYWMVWASKIRLLLL